MGKQIGFWEEIRIQAAVISSIGKWGGVYWYRGNGVRLCLGWIAITVLPVDGDVILHCAARYCDQLATGKAQW